MKKGNDAVGMEDESENGEQEETAEDTITEERPEGKTGEIVASWKMSERIAEHQGRTPVEGSRDRVSVKEKLEAMKEQVHGRTVQSMGQVKEKQVAL